MADRNDMIITKADNGGAVVIIDVEDYVKEAEHQLSNKDGYKKLQYDPTQTHSRLVNDTITRFKNDEGIKAVREAYDNDPNKTVATKVVITFLCLVLTLNNFVFNSINYLQIMECAMGTICAPAYVNIFMAQFEKQHIYPYIKNKSILYLRYIDDIFMIWTGTKQELLIFLENLNRKHKTIKFEHNISHSRTSFLDTLIYIYIYGQEQYSLQKTH